MPPNPSSRWATTRIFAVSHGGRSFEFESATLSTDPDFNNKSLRGNLVFRWEYVKGSTLFVVWNRSTKDDARAGQFSPGRDLRDAFSAPGTNVFIVKLNYWLGL